MKLNIKYILCFFIGIMLYLLLNNINTFNIGIPPPPLPPGSSPGRPMGGGSSKSGSGAAAAAAAAGGAGGGGAGGAPSSGGAGAKKPIEYYCGNLGINIEEKDRVEEKKLEQEALQKLNTYINTNMSDMKEVLLFNSKQNPTRLGFNDLEIENYFRWDEFWKNPLSYKIESEDDIARFLCFIYNKLASLHAMGNKQIIPLQSIGEVIIKHNTVKDTMVELSKPFSEISSAYSSGEGNPASPGVKTSEGPALGPSLDEDTDL